MNSAGVSQFLRLIRAMLKTTVWCCHILGSSLMTCVLCYKVSYTIQLRLMQCTCISYCPPDLVQTHAHDLMIPRGAHDLMIPRMTLWYRAWPYDTAHDLMILQNIDWLQNCAWMACLLKVATLLPSEWGLLPCTLDIVGWSSALPLASKDWKAGLKHAIDQGCTTRGSNLRPRRTCYIRPLQQVKEYKKLLLNDGDFMNQFKLQWTVNSFAPYYNPKQLW